MDSNSAFPNVAHYGVLEPKPLFNTRMLAEASVFQEYEVKADGQRFLIEH